MIFSMVLTVKNRVQMGDICGQSLAVEWAVTRQGCSLWATPDGPSSPGSAG